MSDTGREIEPRVDRPAVEGLDLGLLGRMAELAFALTFQPELVIVAAIPALDIPFISIAALLRPVLELVGQGHPGDIAAMHPDETLLPFLEEQLRIDNRGSGILWSRKRRLRKS